MGFKLAGMTFGEGTGSENQVPITNANQRRIDRKRRKAEKLRQRAEELTEMKEVILLIKVKNIILNLEKKKLKEQESSRALNLQN